MVKGGAQTLEVQQTTLLPEKFIYRKYFISIFCCTKVSELGKRKYFSVPYLRKIFPQNYFL